MKVEYSKYQLQWKGNPYKPPREGALLKVQVQEGNFGYADCHPWTEFGDVPLSEQLRLLSEGKTSPLLNRSLHFAQIDGKARASKIHLFTESELPQNHYHISSRKLLSESFLNQFAHDGFRLIKVKMGDHFADDCSILKNFSESLRTNGLKLRLDFNNKLTKTHFLAFIKQNHSFLDVIDNFEDPFPYSPLDWQEVRENHPIKLACDYDSIRALKYPHSCDFLVIKPAIQEIAPFLSTDLQGRRLIITSYLDHPLGQLAGLHEAAAILKNCPKILSECGFLSHHAYHETSFSKAFNYIGSKLIPSMQGYGFGYDPILENLYWSPLI